MISTNLPLIDNTLNFTIDIRYLGKKLVGTGKCDSCNQIKDAVKFHSKTECSACYHKKHRASNKSYLKVQKIKRDNRTEEQIEKDKKRKFNYRQKNKELIYLYKKEYRKNNPNSRKGENQFRERTIKNQIIAKYFKKEIINIYKTCPENMQVDHIIPLLNKNICGLHVPWNLQYLSPSENNKKNNHWDGTYDNKNWKKS